MSGKTVSVSFSTVNQTFPAGTSFGGYLVTLGSNSQLVQAPPAVWSNVAPGTYAINVQAVDSAQNPVGSPQTGSVTVLADVVVAVPASGSVTGSVS